jgi:predicted ATPase
MGMGIDRVDQGVSSNVCCVAHGRELGKNARIHLQAGWTVFIFYEALSVARRQSAKIFELRTATSLARLWRDQSKRTEARDLLAPIYGWFTEGFETPVLKEAKALFAQLA